MSDLLVENHGSIFLLIPVTQDGLDWIDANIGVGPEIQTWGDGVVVEHRYIGHIVEGALADGLQVQ
jgi:hypothetical protein